MRSSWIIAVLGCWQLSAAAAPVVVDYTNAVAAANLSQAAMDRVNQLRWFFAHASVGQNIMSGLIALHAANSNHYQLSGITAVDKPPTNTTVPGTVYDYDRGNPGWKAKVDGFSTYVTNGWRLPKVDVVLNKFCYIDPDADVNYYITNTAALELANPETMLVYATMPLDTTVGADNAARNIFNDTLRSWVWANNRILYDIADMEAHDTNGVLQVFTYTNSTYAKLFPGYTSDGGHLTTPASQRLVALGFYALGAALVNADRDGDGMPDWWENANGLNPFNAADANSDSDGDGVSNLKEYLSGTNPNDPSSLLRLTQAAFIGGAFQMEFVACANVTYTVQQSTNIATGWLSGGVIEPAAYERTILYVDANAAPNSLYRVIPRRTP